MANGLTPKQYLEALQEKIYVQRGINKPRVESRPSREQTKYIDEWLHKWASPTGLMLAEVDRLKATVEESFKTKVPTKFEDPLGYNILCNLYDEIEAAASKLSIGLPISPQLGTLPIGSINAITIAVPGSDEYLVIFEQDLVIFALTLSKAIARAMFIGRTADDKATLFFKNSNLSEILRNDEDMIVHFIEVIVSYLLLGTPSSAPMHPSEPESGLIAKYLSDSMLLFILGHECAHIMLGHLAYKKVKAAVAGEQIYKIERDWQQEREADGWGLSLMLQAMLTREMDLALSYWGADFFFSCFEIVERGLSLLMTGDESKRRLDSSHPPASERRKLLREMLPQFGPQSAGAFELAVKLEVLVEEIWKGVRSILQQKYQEGQRPAARWQRVQPS